MEIEVRGRGRVLIPFRWINETELLPLHKLPDTENTNRLVPLLLNAARVQGDKLLSLTVTLSTKLSAVCKNLGILHKS